MNRTISCIAAATAFLAVTLGFAGQCGQARDPRYAIGPHDTVGLRASQRFHDGTHVQAAVRIVGGRILLAHVSVLGLDPEHPERPPAMSSWDIARPLGRDREPGFLTYPMPVGASARELGLELRPKTSWNVICAARQIDLAWTYR